MNWDEDLPDASQWQPRTSNQNALSNTLMMTCQLAQRRIVSRAQAEIDFNIQNFDSGPGVEDIVREELANLLPQRYSADAGVVSDRRGNTAGDVDMVVRDHIWSPVIRHGATAQSRRRHFAIEGIYAALEIKQTLGFRQLDDAMQKLVILSRLDRKDNPYGHITENQHMEFLDKDGQILNPLYTTVFAPRLQGGVTFAEIANRFGKINKTLNRYDMVTMLCVLGHGTAWYSVRGGSPYNADFMRDRREPLILQINEAEPQNAFYRLYVLLAGHLNRSVLGLTEVFNSYGDPPPSRTTRSYPEAAFNSNSNESS